MKYFIMNKELDYKRGASYGLEFDNSGIWMASEQGNFYSLFISRLLDSHESETIWGDLSIQMEKYEYTSVRVTFYGTENRMQESEETLTDINDILTGDLGMDAKLDWMKPFRKKIVSDVEQVLLHEIKSRYLWFTIEFFRQGVKSPKVNSIKISFPKQTWLDYLPEVYQSEKKSSEFLERYLSIFQSLYDKMNEKIIDMPRNLDPGAAEQEFLVWIAGWLGEKKAYIWTESQLRTLLEHAMHYYRIRGTVKSVEEIIALYTGEKPYIVEYHKLNELKKDKKQRKLLETLYGEDPFSFSLLIKEEYVPTNKEYQTMIQILNDVKPAHMEVHVVVIRPYIFLDSYTYLGVNSVLGRYRSMTLDDLSILPFAVVGDGKEDS